MIIFHITKHRQIKIITKTTDESQTTHRRVTDDSQTTTDESQTTTDESQTTTDESQASHRRLRRIIPKVFLNTFSERTWFPNAPMKTWCLLKKGFGFRFDVY